VINMTAYLVPVFRLAAVLAVAIAPAAEAGDLQPARLRCEYRVNPQGIDEAAPRLSWIVVSDERGRRQTACQILVASSLERLSWHQGDLWDTGRVTGDETVNVPYAGKPLASRQVCHWKVRIWDEDEPSAWSEPATWSMGLIEPEDWEARYISYRDQSPVYRDPAGHFLPPARQYRKAFETEKEIRRATILSYCPK
jgi:alpha-L-rhamnosidase